MDKEWIEIRSWPGHEEEESMLEIVYYLYNSDEPCEFVAANMELQGAEKSGGGAERGVRYFLGLPSASKDVIMERLEGRKYDVREGPGCKPPSLSDYGVEAELESKRHYGVPFLEGITRSYGRDSFDDHPDISGSLVSALSSGGMIRVAFSRSDRAKRGAHKHAGELAKRAKQSRNGGYSPGQEAIMGKSHDGVERGSQNERTVRDQELEERAERWKDRVDSGMFACDARVYGDSQKQVKRLAAIFPFRPNSLRINRVETGEGKKKGPEPDPEVPFPHRFRKYVPFLPVAVSFLLLIWLSGGLRGGLMTVAEMLGGFPQSLLSSAPEAALLFSGLAGTLAWFAKDMFERNHVALSIPELSLVISIPEKLARFGEKGQEPASRTRSFSFEEEIAGEEATPEGHPETPPPEPEREKRGEEPPEEKSREPKEEEESTKPIQRAQEEQTGESVVAPADEPTEISGTLCDPSTGEELSNVSYEVLMGGEPYYSGETDEDGSYSFTFTPPDPGIYTLSVNLKGYPKVGQEITVDSRQQATDKPEREAPAEQKSVEETVGKSEEREEESETAAEQDESFRGPPPAEKYEAKRERGGED